MRQRHFLGDSDCAGCGRECRFEGVRLRQIALLSVVGNRRGEDEAPTSLDVEGRREDTGRV